MKKIDTKFNVIWTFIIFFVFTLDYWIFDYTPGPRESETIFDQIEHPIIALFILVFFSILVVSTVSKLFMDIWNRLITDLFSIRNIGFAESYALCFLLAGIVFGLTSFY